MNIQQIVYKLWADCDVNERKVQLAILERCYGLRYGKPDFWYFLNWCRILSTPTYENPGGLISFRVLPHNRELIDAFLVKRLISVMKSRQIWISYTTAAYVLWFASSHRGANNMLFSKGEKEAFELLAKCYRIHRHLPPILKWRQHPDSSEEMGFPSMESSIKAFPSTESSGISYTGSIIVSDEHVEHPYDKENYISAKPTIESSGGQYISIFTPNKTKFDKLAFSLWRNAPGNGFHPLFFPYDVLPERDEEWYESIKNNLTAEELSGLTPELYMESNYPRSVEEALRRPQTTLAFDVVVLDRMIEEARYKSPIKVSKDGIDPLIINIYQDYHIGDKYIAASDTSHGIGKDYNVTGIMNVRTGVVVADIMNNKISPEELAQHSVAMLGLYHDPLWYIEDNDWGRVTITTAQNLGYKNFGYRDEKEKKIGWQTNEKTRVDLWGGVIPAINNGQITSYNREGIKQGYDIIRNIEKNGRIEASPNGHDDYFVMLGICWAKKGEVQLGITPAKPIESLTFGKQEPDIIKRWIKGG